MNESTKIQKEQIIRDFGLQIEEVEPLVYKVTNNININTTSLQDKLECSILITSNENEDETSIVHYISLTCDKCMSKYTKDLRDKGINPVCEPYNAHAFSENSIDTIYGAWEV